MLLEVFHSVFTDPYYNLALEEYLLQRVKEGMIILYLWRNDNAIILGQNQNPYLQCNIEYVNYEKIRIARRLSGGGTVFHDMGNLNCTVLCAKQDFNKEIYFQILFAALARLGIQAKQSGRNDIVANGAKISGTAFYSDGHACYQHGCILINSNLEKMFQCLKVKRDKIIGKDIDSVRSRVINLTEINSNITVEQVSMAIQMAFQEAYPEYMERTVDDIAASDNYQRLLEKYSSWEWNMGKQLESKMALYERFSWGDCSLILNVQGGRIRDTGLYTDSMETEIFGEIRDTLKGVRFSKKEIVKALNSIAGSADMIEDIKRLIQNADQLLED